MLGQIKVVNDPVELVPLLVIFNNTAYKKIFDSLSLNWMTQAELAEKNSEKDVEECLLFLRKGSLIDEQWRMPTPGQKSEKEYRATYTRFRSNIQCNFADLADILYISTSNDEELRERAQKLEEELDHSSGSIGDLARKVGVSQTYIKSLSKRIPHLDVKGQGLVRLEK
ncbi:MAG: ArsR family transcriptional regulator [Euryarchaeota archaeon]|nr:ArsR family transcriptional regulator [Euryarchaeota archaeon]